jgi:hypothetical protein
MLIGIDLEQTIIVIVAIAISQCLDQERDNSILIFVTNINDYIYQI